MSATPAIITYHGVGDATTEGDPHELLVPEATFDAQMQFLAKRRIVVPLEEIVRGPARGRTPTVAITFDDAYRSVLETASPILMKYGLPSTLFVPTRWLGERNDWIEPPANVLEIMDPDQIREVERRGIAVESHGHAHISYETSPPEAIEADALMSIERLSDILGRKPRYLAYPFGPTSVTAMSIVERLGFDAAFTIERPHQGLFAFERSWIRPRHGLRVFALKTSGYWSAAWRWSKLGRASAAAVRPFIDRGS
jgi:peptidoglycan/xylan/chitin deacetylase (PgdA/CDA1 family)